MAGVAWSNVYERNVLFVRILTYVFFTVCVCMCMCMWVCGYVCVCVCVWSPATHVLGYCGSGCMIDGSARPQSPQSEPPDSMSLPVSSDWVCVCVCLNMRDCVCVCVWPVPTPHCNRIGGWGWPASVCLPVCVCVCACVCVCVNCPRSVSRWARRPRPFPVQTTRLTKTQCVFMRLCVYLCVCVCPGSIINPFKAEIPIISQIIQYIKSLNCLFCGPADWKND